MTEPQEKTILDLTLGEVVTAVVTQGLPGLLVFIGQAIAFTYTLGYTFGVGLHAANDRLTVFVTGTAYGTRVQQVKKLLGSWYHAIQIQLQSFSQIQ
jgi:hypothetical protein